MRQMDTILLVEDIEKTKVFYKDLLGLEILYDWETMVIFKDRLAFHQRDKVLPQEWSKKLFPPIKEKSTVIYLELSKEESLEGKLQEFKDKGIPILHEIQDLPWQRIFRAKDPDGHCIEIGAHMDYEDSQ